ncbi:MAG: hypothetical protein E4G89_02245 [Methanothrix sp.]|nr:MAG: hypothetical protein E4G89_02245 [Methanothrix sp.]
MATIEEQIEARFPPKKPQELPVRMVPKRRPSPLVQPGATVLLPAQDLVAILAEVRRQGELLREHDARLNKHSERIDDLAIQGRA